MVEVKAVEMVEVENSESLKGEAGAQASGVMRSGAAVSSRSSVL